MNCSRRLPDFVAVGPQRTGTTWLHQRLAGHIGLPTTKETDFFSKHFEQGLDWYLAYFSNCRADRPMGEVNPNYFGIPQAYERIARMIPRCKIVVSLRDPTERAWSSYRAMRRDAWTRVGFEETVARSDVIRESSRYAFHLGNLRRLFGADRVLVLFYEDLEANPQSYLDHVCHFIGAPRISIDGTTVATERVNAVTHAPRSRRTAQNARNARDWMMKHRWHRTLALLETIGVWRRAFGGGEEFGVIDPDVEAQLREHFRSEVEALEQMVGRDLRRWKKGPLSCRVSTS
jgi:hypothetical protein